MRWPLLTLVCLVAVGLGGCGDAGPGRAGQGCDDRIRPSTSVPAATRARLDAAGIEAVVGSGEVAFVAPDAEHWSSVVANTGSRARAKLALWVDSAGPLPRLAVARLDGGARGNATLAPTAEVLPGAVPAGAVFPGPGCWEVVAAHPRGRARIVVSVT